MEFVWELKLYKTAAGFRVVSKGGGATVTGNGPTVVAAWRAAEVQLIYKPPFVPFEMFDGARTAQLLERARAMRTIHKFNLFRIGQVNEVEMPRSAITRRVAMQGSVLCLWAEVETDEPKKVRRFSVVGTGHPIAENAHYIGTCDDGQFVWHVFELIG